VVSGPVPLLRQLRPEVPRKLERVVLRGLERGRERRWQTLGELRDALLELMPSRMTRGGLGVRCAAYLLDFVALLALTTALEFTPLDGAPGTRYWLEGSCELIYFAAGEYLFGCTPGKFLLRLRVVSGDG